MEDISWIGFWWIAALASTRPVALAQAGLTRKLGDAGNMGGGICPAESRKTYGR